MIYHPCQPMDYLNPGVLQDADCLALHIMHSWLAAYRLPSSVEDSDPNDVYGYDPYEYEDCVECAAAASPAIEKVSSMESELQASIQRQQALEKEARVLVSLGLTTFAADKWEAAFEEMKRQVEVRRTLEALRIEQSDICPICGEHCQDDIEMYGMCAECHDKQQDCKCDACSGAGETWEAVSPFVDERSPNGLRPVRCGCCEGTGVKR